MDFRAHLTVAISKQGGRYVAYSPALDISTSGKTKAAARKRFEELVPLFFEELEEAGTTTKVLTELGWQKQKTAKTAEWKPPVVKNERIRVQIPVAA